MLKLTFIPLSSLAVSLKM